MNYMKMLEKDIKEQNEVEVCRELTHLALELLGYIRIGKVKSEGVRIVLTEKWGTEVDEENLNNAMNAMTITMAKAICKIGRIAELRKKEDFFKGWSEEQIERLCKDVMEGKVD